MKQTPQTHLNITLIITFIVAIAGLILSAKQNWQDYQNAQQVHQLILASNSYIEATKALANERGRSFLYLSNTLKDDPTQHKAFILQQRQIANEQLDTLFSIASNHWSATLSEIEQLKQEKKQLDELRYQINEQFEYASLPDNQLAKQNFEHISLFMDKLENVINLATNQTAQIPGSIVAALRMSIVLNRWRESIQNEAITMLRASRMLIDGQLHDQLAAQEMINQDKIKNAQRMTLASGNSTAYLADIEYIQQTYQAQIVPLRQQLLNPASDKPSIDTIIAAYTKVLSEFNQKTRTIFAELQQLNTEQKQHIISEIRIDGLITIITLFLLGYLLFVIRHQVLAPLEQLRTLVNTTVDGIITIDDKGIIQTINNATTTLFGYHETELIGNNIKMLMPEDIDHAHDGYIDRYLNAPEDPHIIGIGREVVGKRKDGSTFAMHLSVGVNRDSLRTRFVGVIHNIEAQKQAQIDLLLFHRVFEASEQGIGIATPDGIILYSNPAHDRIHGYPHEEVIGRHFSQFLSPETFATSGQEIMAAIQEQKSWIGLLPVLQKFGTKATTYANVSAIYDATGKPQYIFNIMSDYTLELQRQEQLAQAKEDAELASKAKSEFLSSMSHELRTPLNAIIGFSQLLESDPIDVLTEMQQDSVHRILAGANHLLKLINEILDLSRIEAGHLQLSLEAVQLDSLLNECVELVTPMMDKKQLILTREWTTEQNTWLWADLTRIKQVVINLLSNACKYNRQQGSITLSASRIDQDMIRISVDDTGIGMNELQLNNLFQAFNRVGAENTSIEGTGIGLVISKRIVEAMNGSIGASSEAGKGSHFWIDMPLTPAPIDAQPVGDNTTTTEPQNLNSSQPQDFVILYVEDNPANLKLVERILSRHQHIKLISAATGSLGYEMALSHQPNLILLDINLPGMSGFEVLEHLKQQESMQHIPVIALSANAMPKDIARGLAAGFSHYLTKPIDINFFNAIIEQIIKSQPSLSEMLS